MTRIAHRTYQSRRTQYDRIRHALDGQDAMRENAALYLRRPEGLTKTEWENYVRGAPFYPVAESTTRAAVGLCFRKPPSFTVPPRLEPMLRRASYDGNSIEVLSEFLLREIVTVGRVCALLDFPINEGQLDSLSVPHISTFQAEDIRDWKMGLVGGEKRLTMLRLHEFNEDLEDTGTEQHLVLELDPLLTIRRFHIKRGADGNAIEMEIHEPIVPTVNGKTLAFIPAIVFSPYNLSPDTEKPPLLDLVDTNIQHYQHSAELAHALWMSSMPTPVVTGSLSEDQKPRAIGPGTIWFLPQGATAQYLSAPSDAHASLRTAIQDTEMRMNALGATMILSGQRRQETAETASMRYQNDTSMLLSSITMLEAGLRTLLSWAADWVQPGEVIVEFNRDLISSQIDHNLVKSLLAAVNAGALSRQSFIDALRKGEVIDRTTEDELDLIEEEGGDMGNILPMFAAQQDQ